MSEKVRKTVLHRPRAKLVPVNFQLVHNLTRRRLLYPQHRLPATTLKQIEWDPVILLDQIHCHLRPRTTRMTIAMLT